MEFTDDGLELEEIMPGSDFKEILSCSDADQL